METFGEKLIDRDKEQRHRFKDNDKNISAVGKFAEALGRFDRLAYGGLGGFLDGFFDGFFDRFFDGFFDGFLYCFLYCFLSELF